MDSFSGKPEIFGNPHEDRGVQNSRARFAMQVSRGFLRVLNQHTLRSAFSFFSEGPRSPVAESFLAGTAFMWTSWRCVHHAIPGRERPRPSQRPLRI